MRSFIVFCSLAALVCVLFGSIEAKPELRKKRALSQEDCDSSWTQKQCEEYAEDQRKKSGDCLRAEVSGLHIEWAGCGTAHCGENTRLIPSDLTKPYPDCCEDCEVIDPSKPATYSRVGK